MRIAYITETYPPELNGVALTVSRAVEYLRREGHDVELIRPRQPGEAPVEDAAEWRTASVPIPMYADFRLGLARVGRCIDRFEQSRPDLVHVATEGPLGWAASRAARSLGIPVTSDFRTNFHQYSRYYKLGWFEGPARRYLRGFHNATAATFVPTEPLRAELASQGFKNLIVIGRGVDTSQFDPAFRDEALRSKWGATEHAPVLLYVGRVASEKNIPLLMRAFEAVRRRNRDARLVVVGDGPLRASLESEHPEIVFTGSLRGDALARCYASADLFVFPSLSETFGNVVVEALASGLAVVAYRCAAAGELIEHGVSGMLAEPGDGDAFVQATCLAACGLDAHAAGEASPSHQWPVPGLSSIRAKARAVAIATGWEPVLQRFDTHLKHIAHENKKSDDSSPVLAERPL